ncbi:permease prefix domain 1-containing protein [Tumebacillus flagellatus]|uniref:Uncharacterized protein n=1 Tax=Tumebacillus flagellatus TaxID=1157490 RepID=A0A074M485_9BACL|nr:permease prefix domain 1-containing protein [Tumebacillus flagellatus]KEO80817.1 hypothetical protein EL26_24265 [Tumebacillus flagellatus]
MKAIEGYLEDLYRDVRISKEAAELKAEMRGHLQQAVEELMAEGLSEEESVQVALERFGDQKQLVSEMEGVLKVQRVFAKNLLRTALAFLVVGFAVLAAMSWMQSDLERNWYSQTMSWVDDERTVLPVQNQQKLTEMVLDSALLHGIEIDSVDPSTYEPAHKFYSYEKTDSGPIIWPILPGFGGKSYVYGPWMLTFHYRDLIGTGAAVFVFCAIVYWVLFAVWGTVNAYHRGRFHWAWVFVFALFNVLGYLLYWAEQKRWRLLSPKFA